MALFFKWFLKKCFILNVILKLESLHFLDQFPKFFERSAKFKVLMSNILKE